MTTNTNSVIDIANDDELDEPKYAVYSKTWGPDFTGLSDSNESDADFAGILGEPITNITIGAKGIKKFRIRTKKKGKWHSYQNGFNKTTAKSDGTAITGIEIVGKGYCFAVHIKGGTWLPTAFTSDTDGEVLVGSGSPIDAIWIDKL